MARLGVQNQEHKQGKGQWRIHEKWFSVRKKKILERVHKLAQVMLTCKRVRLRLASKVCGTRQVHKTLGGNKVD